MSYFTNWIINVTSQFIPLATTVSSTTNTTPGCSCLNDSDDLCLFFGKDFCYGNAFIGEKHFRDFCLKLCGMCPTTTCYDRQYCDYFAQFRHECSKLAKIKPHPCAKTCAIC